MMFHKIKSLGHMFCMCVVLVAGCSSGGGGGGVSTVTGHVYLDDNQKLASVEIYDSSGNTIQSVAGATDEYGTFQSDVNNLPSEFEVRATIADPALAGAGIAALSAKRDVAAENGDKGTALLRARVSNFSSNSGLIAVNLVTTLACAYRDAHPDLSHEQAVTAVKTFLELPLQVDITRLWGDPGNYFLATLFLAEARSQGGIDSFISSLVAESDRGGTHPFNGKYANPGGDTDWTGCAKWVGGNLASGVVASIGGNLFGMALQGMGIDFGMGSLMADMSAKLSQISAQITELGNQLNAKLDNYYNKQTYNQLITSEVSKALADIETWHDKMQGYADDINQGTPFDRNELEDLAKEILANESYLTLLHHFQVGRTDVQLPSAMQTLRNVVVNQGFYCNEVHYTALWTQFNAIQGRLFQMLNLVTSAYSRGVPPSLGRAAAAYESYWKFAREEYGMLPYPLQNDTVVLDRTYKLLWTRAPVGEAIARNIMDFTNPFPNPRVYPKWASLDNFANNYRVGPYGNWRIPTRDELATLGPYNGIKTQGFKFTDHDLSLAIPCRSVEDDFMHLWWVQTGDEFKDFLYSDYTFAIVLVSDLPKQPREQIPIELWTLDQDTTIAVNWQDPSKPYFETQLYPERVFHLDTQSFGDAYGYGFVLTPSKNDWATGIQNRRNLYNSSFYWESADETVATVSNQTGPSGFQPFVSNTGGYNEGGGFLTYHKALTPITVTASRWIGDHKLSLTTSTSNFYTASNVTRTLKSIAVYPQNKLYTTLPSNVRYYAVGVYSDGTSTNLTTSVTWSTSGPAHFSSQQSYEGYLTVSSHPTQAQLPLTVTATYQGVTGTTEYKVPTGP